MIRQLFNQLNKDDFQLPKGDPSKEIIRQRIADKNLLRAYLLCIATFIIEPLIIIFYDIPAIREAKVEMKLIALLYLLLHGGFLIVCITLLLYSRKNHRRAIPFATFIGLTIFAVINTLDIYTMGSGTSFMLYFVILALLLIHEFPRSFFPISIPFALYLAGMVLFMDNKALLKADLINSLSLYVTIILIAVIMYQSYYREIAKDLLLEEQTLQLHYLAKHDALTNLYNRRRFEEEILSRKITEGAESTVVVIDIDHFKKVNDQYGHPAADEVLKQFAATLLNSIRNDDLVARWGGEEFLLYLHEMPIQEAMPFVEFIRSRIAAQKMTANEFTISVTASFGLTAIHEISRETFKQAYNQADLALYQAKSSGRNQVISYSPEQES